VSFRHRQLILAIAALLGIVITALLGRWQLSRADQRERMQMTIDAKQQLPALETAALTAMVGGFTDDIVAQALHRKANVRGTWLPQHTVFLDNRQMFGRPGFYVMTPLQLEGSSSVLMVQRGWVARNFVDRNQLPNVATSQGVVEIKGRLAGPPTRLLDLGTAVEPATRLPTNATAAAPGFPPIRQNLDLTVFAKETKLALMPLTLMQTSLPTEIAVTLPKDGLQRDWPQVNSGAIKNYGYAAQWFALSALIAGLYGWFQFGKPYVAKQQS
jgi:surfeit locus 1 family protein